METKAKKPQGKKKQPVKSIRKGPAPLEDVKKTAGPQRRDSNGLFPKQSKFVREYIKDYCGSKAAIRAGYSTKGAAVTGSQLLIIPNVIKAIENEEKKLQNRFIVTKERILKELSLIGFSDLSEYVSVDKDGLVQINSMDSLPPQVSRALKTIKEKTESTSSSDGETVFSKSQLEVVLHDKIAALQLMGKEIGMFKEKIALTGEDGGPVKFQGMSNEELLRIIQSGGPGAATAPKGKR